MEVQDDQTGSPLTPAGGGPSDFQRIGLPILLLCLVLIIFFSIHAAITWLPELEWWKKLTGNYKSVDDDKATFLQRRRGSLRRKLNRYKDDSKARGNDGRGGVSTGEVSKDDFDYVPKLTKPNEATQKLSKASSKTSIEEGDQPLSVSKFYNKAFENDLEEGLDDLATKPILREKKTNKQLERYRHSAEFYSQFSLVPLENGESGNGSVESISATVHSFDEPVAPRRKKYMSTENLSDRQNDRSRLQRSMAVSMNDLRPSMAISMNDLQQREYEAESHMRYPSKSNAKSVDDVRKNYGGSNLSMYQSANDIRKTYGGSNGHISNQRTHIDRAGPPRSAAKSVDDVRRADQYEMRVHRSTAISANTPGQMRSPAKSVDDVRRGDEYETRVHRSTAISTNKPGQMRSPARSVEDIRRASGYDNGLSFHRDTAYSADDLRNEGRHNRKQAPSPPSSASSSYQSLDENSQDGRPRANRPSYAKPRASTRKKRAPQPRQMPGIPEHNANHTAALYGHSNSSHDQPAILQTSHTYDTNYTAAAVYNQRGAMV